MRAQQLEIGLAWDDRTVDNAIAHSAGSRSKAVVRSDGQRTFQIGRIQSFGAPPIWPDRDDWTVAEALVRFALRGSRKH